MVFSKVVYYFRALRRRPSGTAADLVETKHIARLEDWVDNSGSRSELDFI